MSLLALTRLWGLAVSVRNLTERRGNDRLASLVERSSDVVMLVDVDGRISYTSPALRTVLGYEGDLWVGLALEAVDIRANGELQASLWSDFKELPHEGSLTIEVSVLHADGEWRTMELSAVNLMSNVAVAGIVLTLRDVTANRTLERQLSYRADHDSLTGLANRANFLTRVSDELQRGQLPTVLFLDLDDFKAINDGLGHSAGDVLLRVVADRLKIRFANASNLVARLGGDEFGVLLLDSSTAEASVLAQQAIGDLKDSIQVNDFQSVSVSGCIGIAVAEPKNTASDLMRHADLAMYRAKQLGKGQVEGFDADLGRQTERRNEYKRDLMAALGRDQLYLVYQPIVRLSDGRTVGAEALLAMGPPHLRKRAPDRLHPACRADRCDHSDRRVGDRAGMHVGRGLGRRIDVRHRQRLGRSAARTQLRRRGRSAACDSAASQPERLVLEITESTLIDDSELATRAAAANCARAAISTALDDFGTGYSSLAYVQRLPLDIIKIDKEFVQSVDELRSQALANTIVNMARNLGLRTVAEGVESENQAVELARIGCEFAQGYLFFKPLSAVAMTALSEFESQPVDEGGPTIELPAQAAKTLPPPTGQLRPPNEAHPAPAPAAMRLDAHPRPQG